VATLYLHHPVFLEHLLPGGHPECPERLMAIAEALSAPQFDSLVRKVPPAATLDTVTLAHDRAFIDLIAENAPSEGFVRIDADTFLSPKSLEAALHAAGAACLAVDDVMAGQANNAFCAVRPPGHHAESHRAMGFCLFNNAVIGARWAQRNHRAERVAIVDWDVHHGNGTQDIVWADPTIFYASTHQMPLYPGIGAPDETGVGNIVNVPLSPGAGRQAFRQAFEDRILPSLNDFRPDLIVISAGFDAHRRDPLAAINLDEDDFAWATEMLMALASQHCDGRIVSVLEGGYDLQALSLSVAAHVAALMRA